MSRGYGYNLVNMCFFITYILLQPGMIVLCRKIGPRFFLPGICIIWGSVIIGFGFAKNWTTLIPLRLLLGALESGYFPGCLYILSCWYTKCEFLEDIDTDIGNVLIVGSRGRETLRSLLPHWKLGLSPFWYSCLWPSADGRSSGDSRMAMVCPLCTDLRRTDTR